MTIPGPEIEATQAKPSRSPKGSPISSISLRGPRTHSKLVHHIMMQHLPDPDYVPVLPARPTLCATDLAAELSSLELEGSADISDCETCDSTPSSLTSTSCMSACCPPPDKTEIDNFEPVSIAPENFTQVLVVGGGPHSLALCARLADSHPASLYTDLEHARLSWLHARRPARPSSTKHKPAVKGHWAARKLVQTCSTCTCSGSDLSSVVRVIDASGKGFLARWNSFFRGLEIQYLRSPMLFHPSPADNDALVAYARRVNREDELMPIDNVVGAEKSKHERKKRHDYFRPSSALFRDFIEDELVKRYHLQDLVTHGKVVSVSRRQLHVQGQELVDGFRIVVVMPDGTVCVFGAAAVVFAVGPSSTPFLPPTIEKALARSERGQTVRHGQAWCHSTAFADEGFCFPPPFLAAKIAQGNRTTLLVIGGGLTSAQIVDQAIRKGVSKVILLCRGSLKVKHFDMDLEWVSKYNNLLKAAFWQEECPLARHATIMSARNGGSVNPQFASILNKHVKSRQLDLHLHTTVAEAQYRDGLWSIKTSDSVSHHVDYVVCSTGSKLDFASVECVQPMLDSVQVVNGLPRLTPDLQIDKDLPVFVMGAYAMLELGPDALNLSGTRHGAERITHKLVNMGIVQGHDSSPEKDRVSGKGSFFAALAEVAA
ncbi:hypothetical protein OIV83_003465 [Microbotryomycetes sp. JL201]|nr:hypothetical protein OIV83_003465 [Microbotryomycetes sp. JL201]